MPSLKAVPQPYYLMGLANPEISTPTSLRGHATEEMRLVSPLPTEPQVLLPLASSPTDWGPQPILAVVIQVQCVCVCVWCVVCGVCVCVYVHVCVCV